VSNQAARNAVGALIDEWLAGREALREIERAEHPDITDTLGRVWVWWKGDLYTHDGMAWPQEFVAKSNVSRPSQHALDNPNYQWCASCKRESP
jgi:hypothetical protein